MFINFGKIKELCESANISTFEFIRILCEGLRHVLELLYYFLKNNIKRLPKARLLFTKGTP